MKILKYILSISFCCVLVTVFGQNAVRSGVTKIVCQGHAAKNAILLRWAPDGEAVWRLGNKYGYVLERFTVVRDGKVLTTKQVDASKHIIKPQPLPKWDTIANADDNAAVIAQAIYGDDFDVSLSDNNKVANILNKTNQATQRYDMAMFAADQSFNAALFSGLAWKDSLVKPNERYLYRVSSAIPRQLAKTDTALVYIGLEDFKQLPKPSSILAEFGDRSVILRWDFGTFRQFYTSYIVERSDDDGKSFKPVQGKPVTNLNNIPAGQKSATLLYIDSFPQNDIPIRYRIAGISLFGDTGPYSNEVAGKGKVYLAVTPAIQRMNFDKGKYALEWDFADSMNSRIKGFILQSAQTFEGPYKTTTKLIPAKERQVAIDTVAATNYYIISAVGIDNKITSSSPYFFQDQDSTPPLTPVNVRAAVDTNGIVAITWDKNTEVDLAGYKVLRRDKAEAEFSPLFDTARVKNIYRDTLNLKMLNKKVFYVVRAVDKHYNESPFSVPVEITKPDKIPPSPAVFKDYSVSVKGLIVQWVNSADEDVDESVLYRKQTSSAASSWVPLQTFKNGISKAASYIDTSAQPGTMYSYTIIVTDSSGNKSLPANPLTIKAPAAERIKTAVKDIFLTVDRDKRTITVAWQQLNVPNVRLVELFRAQDKQPLSLYKQFKDKESNFVDNGLYANTMYKYGVRVLYRNGKYSDLLIKTINY